MRQLTNIVIVRDSRMERILRFREAGCLDGAVISSVGARHERSPHDKTLERAVA